jgi:hypothetical protein
MDTLSTQKAPTLDELRATTLAAIATSGLPQPSEIILTEYEFASGTCRALRLHFDLPDQIHAWGTLIGQLTDTPVPPPIHTVGGTAETIAIQYVWSRPVFLGIWNHVTMRHLRLVDEAVPARGEVL